MEQTLISEESLTLTSRISKLTIFDQFAQTIFVDHSQGFIEIDKSFKEDNVLKFVRTEIAYTLKNHRVISKKMNSTNLLISDLTEGSTIIIDKSICRCVSTNLNKLFIQELNKFQNLQSFEFNLKSQNLFKKYLYPNTEKDLVNFVSKVGEDMTWAIIPYNLQSIFFESDSIDIQVEDNNKIIYKLGKIGKLDIYVNPDDESGKIFFGNYDSIIILANTEMNIFENIHGTDYNFEYLFIEQGKVKTLQVI